MIAFQPKTKEICGAEMLWGQQRLLARRGELVRIRQLNWILTASEGFFYKSGLHTFPDPTKCFHLLSLLKPYFVDFH